MYATRTQRLAPEIEKTSTWLMAQNSYPEHWRRNVASFMRKMRAEFPDLKAWQWLTRTIAGRFEIKQPFGWIRSVLQTPWGHFPEERRQSAFAREPSPPPERGKERKKYIVFNPSPYP